MKARIGDVEIEGTLEEILALKAHLEPRPPTLAPGSVVFDPALNEHYLERFLREAMAKRNTLVPYARVIRRFAKAVEPRSILEATPTDVQTFIQGILSECRHLTTLPARSRAGGWTRCKQGLFGPNLGTGRAKEPKLVTTDPHAVPSFCSTSCPLYEVNAYQATGAMNALASFFNFYEVETSRNPAHGIRRRMARQLDPRQHANKRNAPPLEVVAKIANRALNPAGKAFVSLAAKSGRRVGALLRLEWPDFDLQNGWASFERLRRELLREAGKGRVKLNRLGCEWSFLDAELIRVLLEYKRKYWDVTVQRNAQGEPVTQSVFLNESRDGPMPYTTLVGILDACIRDAGLWEEWGQGEKRITPHVFRHFFTTTMQLAPYRAPREFVFFLRGDVKGDAMSRYEHFPPEDLKKKFDEHIFTLGVATA